MGRRDSPAAAGAAPTALAVRCGPRGAAALKQRVQLHAAQEVEHRQHRTHCLGVCRCRTDHVLGQLNHNSSTGVRSRRDGRKFAKSDIGSDLKGSWRGCNSFAKRRQPSVKETDLIGVAAWASQLTHLVGDERHQSCIPVVRGEVRERVRQHQRGERGLLASSALQQAQHGAAGAA